ncbi:MAG: adenylosuccinate synthase [Candidatus Riflebacteria bacterium RBG_13_59_9]|nr:MAG: adenylosuccinate synthase [Candidatus Riflebacteria bacterium RBG_13_59_9]
MTVVVIVGSQWGDEGKGKLTHYLGADFDLTVRFQGGSNAGHTVITSGETFRFNLVPSSILHRERTCLMGDGMVVNPSRLLQEIQFLRDKDLWGDNLRIGSHAHLVMPYHVLLDELDEKRRGGGAIGTTKQGIGPCYSDKFARLGIRVGELLDPQTLRERLAEVVELKNAVLKGVYDCSDSFSADELYEMLLRAGETLAPLIVNSVDTVRGYLDQGRAVLCEGAQGALLDIDYGAYPFVTSSHTVSAGACLGTGISPGEITKVIGVSKAYTTRVGNGSFPSELTGDIGAHMRERGLEYGTTTGRPRRCGWLDLVLLRYALRIHGCTELALTKIDVLDGLKTVKAVSAYKKDGVVRTACEVSDQELSRCSPVYEEFAGWEGSIGRSRSEDELPTQLVEYVDFIERGVGVPIRMLSVGPDHDETVWRTPHL